MRYVDRFIICKHLGSSQPPTANRHFCPEITNVASLIRERGRGCGRVGGGHRNNICSYWPIHQILEAPFYADFCCLADISCYYLLYGYKATSPHLNLFWIAIMLGWFSYFKVGPRVWSSILFMKDSYLEYFGI